MPLLWEWDACSPEKWHRSELPVDPPYPIATLGDPLSPVTVL